MSKLTRGYISGTADNSRINYCPLFRAVLGTNAYYGDGTVVCNECDFHFAVIECEEKEHNEDLQNHERGGIRKITAELLEASEKKAPAISDCLDKAIQDAIGKQPSRVTITFPGCFGEPRLYRDIQGNKGKLPRKRTKMNENTTKTPRSYQNATIKLPGAFKKALSRKGDRNGL